MRARFPPAASQSAPNRLKRDALRTYPMARNKLIPAAGTIALAAANVRARRNEHVAGFHPGFSQEGAEPPFQPVPKPKCNFVGQRVARGGRKRPAQVCEGGKGEIVAYAVAAK